MAGKERNLRYVGPHVAVDVPALGQVVRRGETVTVDNAALAKGLLAQADNWQEVGVKDQDAGKDNG